MNTCRGTSRIAPRATFFVPVQILNKRNFRFNFKNMKNNPRKIIKKCFNNNKKNFTKKANKWEKAKNSKN